MNGMLKMRKMKCTKETKLTAAMSLGALERLKNELPMTYSAYMSAMSGTSTANEELGVTQTRVVAAGRKKNGEKKVCFYLAITLSGPISSGYVSIVADVKDNNTVVFSVECQVMFKGNVGFMLLEVPEKYYTTATAVIHTTTVTKGSINTCQSELTLNDYSMDINADYVITDPAKKPNHTAADSFINICKVNPGTGKVIDYTCNSNFVLPSNGNLQITDPSVYIDDSKAVESSLYVYITEGNYTFYKNSRVPIEIDVEPKKITWKFNESWDASYMLPGAGCTNDLYYCLTLTCKILNQKQSQVFTITNIPTLLTLQKCKEIDKMKYFKGCLVKGTLITMADGSKKPIEQIAPGEALLGVNGKQVVVSYCVKGITDSLIRVRLEDGKNVLVSPDHPFQTEKQTISANYLQQEKLLTESGELVAVSDTCAEDFGQFEVYNLSLEKPGCFPANGIITGDFSVQAETVLKENDVRNKIDKAWLKDYDTLQKIQRGDFV